MDAIKTNNETKEDEQPHQSKVADLSTTVKRSNERGKKAGSSLKRERSANTTPEMSLPKQGSAKPGAGATPARVPEIEAGSTNRKAAQPPIPKPTEATGTREHRSYSEVTSSDRFAVIAKGYPTALLSTNELVIVREAILDKIREQRQGAVKPYFMAALSVQFGYSYHVLTRKQLIG
ncbi:hypothetical protein ACLKA7_005224 [Drosophila subpalustris]